MCKIWFGVQGMMRNSNFLTAAAETLKMREEAAQQKKNHKYIHTFISLK